MALSSMKKQNDSTLLRDARPILNLKKDTIGTEYTLPSGVIGTKVRVYKNNPAEHHVIIPRIGTKIMSKQGVTDYITTNEYAEDSPLTELYRKRNLIKAGQEELKKIKEKEKEKK
jgi:hypothetical protein